MENEERTKALPEKEPITFGSVKYILGKLF